MSTMSNGGSSNSESSTSSNGEAEAVENDEAGDYRDSVVVDADGRVFLFFHATWCPQCVSIDGDITAKGVPSGVTIVKVDYDSN